MRIGVIHSFYSSQQPSGENEVVTQEVQALIRAGHDVSLIAKYTDQVSQGPGYQAKTALRVATGLGAAPLITHGDAPDVLHIHNLFPNFGKSWIRSSATPMIATVHNYRTVCAAGTFVRDGKACTDCLDAKRNSLVHGCYRGSRLATFPLMVSQRGVDDAVLRQADRLIVMSPAQRMFWEGRGIKSNRLAEIPHFVPDSLDPLMGPGGESWLFAGRLDSVKGADRLFSWPNNVPLRVAGVGPLQAALQTRLSHSNVDFLGLLPRADVLDLLRHSRGLLSLSRAPETFGLVYAEAMAAGTPVLAVPPGAPYSFVTRDGTGLAVREMVPTAIEEANEMFPSLRELCRNSFETHFTEAEHIGHLTKIYESVL